MNDSAYRTRAQWSGRAFVACLCSLVLALGIAGRAVADVPESTDTNVGSALPNGFYRNVNKPTVYRVNDGKVCAVLSERHLRALGATHRTEHVVDDEVDFLNGKPFAPACLWPTGYYHKHGENFIIKVDVGTVCTVTSVSAEDSVFEVGDNDLLTVGRTFIGRCKP